jgi:hypothetical protein
MILQNCTPCKLPGPNNTWVYLTPTIQICDTDPGWEKAFENWKSGKNPTDSKDWKRGVVLIVAGGSKNRVQE